MKNKQVKSSRIVKNILLPGFGERLRVAFQGQRNVDIARRLGVSEPGVKNYLDGRVPPADMLIHISNVTNTSIHWLLTGEGPMEREILKSCGNSGIDYVKLRRDAARDYFLDMAIELSNKDGELKNERRCNERL